MSEYGWHFVGDTLRDGTPIPPDGEWLVHTGPVEICASGLHASLDPFDALEYAPGPILCRVELGDIVARHDDKVVCRRRRIIERHDIADTLRLFARQCALDVIHLWDAPDVVLTYLKTGDATIRQDALAAAAEAAVRAAAAGAAAWAARDAAVRAAAAGAAAWAARDTAWAAREAAWAARAAAGAAQRARFSTLVLPLFREVA